MHLHHAVCSGLILVGAVVMLFSILLLRGLFAYLGFVSDAARPAIRRSLKALLGLMAVFLVGYLFVSGAFLEGALDLNCLVVGVVFFLGAVFVLICMKLYGRMLSEMRITLSGLVPICASCKKIREDDADPREQSSWTRLEEYVSSRTQAEFSHGLCPECLKAAQGGTNRPRC